MKVISIFELGSGGEEMLTNWYSLKNKGTKVSLQEFPTIDLYQIVDNDKELMEFTLEFFLVSEKQKKRLVKEKQARGIAKAREKGIKLGRRPLEIPTNFEEVYQRVKNKEISITAATRILHVDYKTLKKWIMRYKS